MNQQLLFDGVSAEPGGRDAIGAKYLSGTFAPQESFFA
jgi:hypothetical protein